MNSDAAPVAPAQRKLRKIAGWLAWLMPAAALLVVALHLQAAKYPAGADAAIHTPAAAALYYVLHRLPADAPLFLRTLPVDRPPATYLVTAGLLAARRSVWSYHATVLAFAAIFFVCFWRAARCLTPRRDLAALGLLAILANPAWIAAALSYNLDMGAAAAAAALAWIFLAGGESSGASFWLGLLAGLLCLTRLTTAALLAPAVLAVLLWRLGRREWRKTARAMAFLVAAALPIAWWFGPALASGDAWRAIVGGADRPGASPFAPLRLLALQQGGLPLWLALFAATPFVRWRTVPWRAWLLPLAAFGAATALAATGASDPGAALGADALLTLFALAAFDRWSGRVGGGLVYGLLVLYAALAVGVWLPSWRTPVQIASLGSSAPPALVAPARYFWDEQVADAIARAIDGRENCPALALDAESGVNFANIEARLVLAKPYLALMLPLRQSPAVATRYLNDACFLMSMQDKAAIRVAAPEPTIEPNAQTAEASVGNLMNFVESSATWQEVANLPINGKTLTIYKNAAQMAKNHGRTTPDGFLDYYLLNYSDDQRVFLRHAQRLLGAGRYNAAFDHFRAAAEKQKTVGAYDGLLTAAPHVMTPDKEAAFLTGVAMDRPPPAIMLRVVRRLYDLESNKLANGRFEQWAIWVLDELEISAAGRAQVVEELFRFYVNGGDPERAAALLDRELPRLAEKELTGALWALAEIAYFKKQNAAAIRLYTQLSARRDLPIRRRSLAAIRMAWLRGEDAAPSFAFENISSPAQAIEAANYLVKQSYRLRLEGRPDLAMLLLFESERWLRGCGVCLDEIALEKARDCLASGDTAEAKRQLKLVRKDPELESIAADLLFALKKRTE